MEINEGILKSEEKIHLKLRELFVKYGYRNYKMSKFEEYDLYGQNKNFLVSDRVITFTDTNGKLLALKPDVTLSIVKNADVDTGVQKLYYSENVYRVSDSVHRYKEFMQTGLEVLGDIDEDVLSEVVLLAAKSLKTIDESSVLVLSHLGVVGEILDRIPGGRNRILKRLGEKNVHEIRALCEQYGVSEEDKSVLCAMAEPNGTGKEALSRICSYTTDSKIKQAVQFVERIAEKCEKETGIKTEVDFSVIGDINYYNGLIMSGFIGGLPGKVLSGGCYDNLMRKMGKTAGGVGFAVYLDQLERLDEGEKQVSNARFINVALPKGRLGKEVYKKFEAAGLGAEDVLSPDTRKLIFENKENGMRFFWVKPSDVAIYVERGAADIGVCGKDILLEYSPDVYELIDLDIGKCRLAVAAKKGFTDSREMTLRVATKFPNVAMDFYAKKGRDIDIIKLNGSIELAPILGLSDVIVDIVETGTTLKENDLEPIETIVHVSARMIANKAFYAFKKEKINAVLEKIK